MQNAGVLCGNAIYWA